MKANQAEVWLVALVVAAAVTLTLELHSQKWMVTPSPGSVFVGWLQKADCVHIHLPNDNIVSYGGEKLKTVVEELAEWQEHAEGKAKDQKPPKK
jgi:hypothetical protein